MEGKPYTTKVDVYSFAIILLEIITQSSLFNGVEFQYEIIDFIRSGRRPAIPESCPSRLAKLITDCWAQNPNSRPDFDFISAELRATAAELGLPDIEVEKLPESRRELQKFPLSRVSSKMAAEASTINSSLLENPDDQEVKARLWNEVQRLRTELEANQSARSQAERALAFQVLETHTVESKLATAKAKIKELQGRVRSLENELLPGAERRRNYRRSRGNNMTLPQGSSRQRSHTVSSLIASCPTPSHLSSSVDASPDPDQLSSSSSGTGSVVPRLQLEAVDRTDDDEAALEPPPIVRHRVVLRQGENLEATLRQSLADLKQHLKAASSSSSDVSPLPSPSSDGVSQTNIGDLMNRMFYGRQALLELMFEFVEDRGNS
jgi:hypothetical protein